MITAAEVLGVLQGLAQRTAGCEDLNRAVCRAIGQIRGRRCQPHWWRMPRKGDDGLTCEACDRHLAFSALTPEAVSSILGAYQRRHGYDATAAFIDALTLAREDADARAGLPTDHPEPRERKPAT